LKFLLVAPPALYAFWVLISFTSLSILQVAIGEIFIQHHHCQALSKLRNSDLESIWFQKFISKKEKREKYKLSSKKLKNSEKYGINDLSR